MAQYRIRKKGKYYYPEVYEESLISGKWLPLECNNATRRCFTLEASLARDVIEWHKRNSEEIIYEE